MGDKKMTAREYFKRDTSRPLFVGAGLELSDVEVIACLDSNERAKTKTKKDKRQDDRRTIPTNAD